MHRIISMWLGSAAFTAALSLGGPLTDLDEQLASESKADAKAAEEAKCWCKGVQSALDDRLRNSDSEISELEHIRDARFYENVGLNVEVKQHQDQIADHTRSLQTSNAIVDKASKNHISEKEETTQALKQLRKAMDIVPKGNEVHGTLKGLEDSFASKLDEAQKDHDTREAQFKDMNSAKSEMLKLAKQSMNSKMRRLADGKQVIAQAKSDLAAYTLQRDADWALQGSLKSVCSDLADGATKREKERQDTVIAISEEKAKNAEKAAMKAMSKVMLLKSKSVAKARCAKVLQALGGAFQGDCAGTRERAEDAKRRADDNLAGSKKAAKDIMTLMEKSTEIQAGLTKVFNKVIMSSHLATSRGSLESGIKSKVSALGKTADEDLKATTALFDKVRAKAKESTKADMKVVTSLQMGAAMASKAVVEAGKCK